MEYLGSKYHDAFMSFCAKHRHTGYVGTFQSAEGFLRTNREQLSKYRAIYQLKNRTWLADENFEQVVLHIATRGRQGALPQQ